MGERLASASINFSPRRIWSGFTIPGKKMMAMLSSSGGILRGQSLIDLYKAAPYRALWSAALALHTVPAQGAQFGPAFRDLSEPLTPGILHGAILTDIRDFLKFRFRANGLAEIEVTGSPTIEEILATDSIRYVTDRDEEDLVVGYIVNYVITALDLLGRDPVGIAGSEEEDFNNSLRRLRDMLRKMAEWSYSRGAEEYRQYHDYVFEEPVEANQDSPAV